MNIPVWLIDWGFTAFSTICQSYHSGQFTYSYVSWLSYTSTSYNIPSKQLAVFPHRLIAHWWKTNDAFHNDFCQRISCRAGVRTHNPWIDSPRRYRLSYRSNLLLQQSTFEIIVTKAFIEQFFFILKQLCSIKYIFKVIFALFMFTASSAEICCILKWKNIA